MSSNLETQFAPPERTPQDILLAQISAIKEHIDLTRVLDAIPEYVMILNKEREIVFANKSLLEYLQVEDEFLSKGFRPGEAINCQHAFESEAGCGTTEFCKTCGAVISILNTQYDRMEDVQECRIMQKGNCNALDLRVKSTRLSIDGEDFTVFTLLDISSEKRKLALEKIFFHDILNTAGGILGYTQILRDADPEELLIFSDSIQDLSKRLIEEIQAQKQLIAAESGNLEIRRSSVNARILVYETIELYKNHVVAEGKRLEAGELFDVELFTDRGLLGRVLGNMVKNALEADPIESVITVSCKLVNGNVIFEVNNKAYMPRNIQLQVFNRSFSSKGKGRGLGTYSMKLISERYLNGSVTFESDREKGTTFRAMYPLRYEIKK